MVPVYDLLFSIVDIYVFLNNLKDNLMHLKKNLGKDPADALQFLNVSVYNGDKCKSVYEERQGFINPKTQLCSGNHVFCLEYDIFYLHM